MKKSFLLLLMLVTACAPGTPVTPAAPSSATPAPTALANVSVSVLSPTSAIAGTSLTRPHADIATATFPSPPAVPVIPAHTARISPADGMTEVLVPAGTLRMGGLDVFAENDELPSHQVTLNGFWIDQTEVTNGMYALCMRAGGCTPPRKLSSARRASYFDNHAFRDYPVIQVTWVDAQDYCAWAGRRLPTEAEWERAARGDDLRTYPWGDEPPSARYANFDNLVRDTSRVGSYAAGASPYGALDMAGNVWEWASDLYDSDFYLTAPTDNPTGPSAMIGRYQRVIRGGSFQDTFVNIRLANRGYELGPNPAAPYGSLELFGHTSAKIGFRCASAS